MRKSIVNSFNRLKSATDNYSVYCKRGFIVPFIAIIGFAGIQSAAAQVTSGKILIGHSNKCVDLPGGELSDNVGINQFQCDGSPEQGFAVVGRGGGYYSIVSNRSNKCLAIYNGSTSDGGRLTQLTCDGSPNQSFSLVSVGNDFYKVAARHSGKCLNVPGGTKDNNVGLTQSRCDGSQAQMFWFQDLVGLYVEQVQQPPVRQTPVQQPPVRQPPVRQPIVGLPPVQQPPVRQPTVGLPPVQQPKRPPVQQPKRPAVQTPQQPIVASHAISQLVNILNYSADVQALKISPDDLRLATGGTKNKLTIWDSSGASLIPILEIPLQGNGDLLLDLAFSPNGERIVTGSRQDDAVYAATINVWDVKTGREALILNGALSEFCASVAYSPNGLLIAGGCFNQFSGDSTLQVWDANTGALKLNIDGVAGPVVFSTDGTRVTGANQYSQELKMYDTRTGSLLLTLQGRSVGGFKTAVYSSDGTFIVTGNGDGTVGVWNAYTGQEYFSLAGHSSRINAIAITKDNSRIVSGDDDGVLILWDASSGQQISSFTGTKPVRSVTFSSDGESVLSGGDDKVLRVFSE